MHGAEDVSAQVLHHPVGSMKQDVRVEHRCANDARTGEWQSDGWGRWLMIVSIKQELDREPK